MLRKHFESQLGHKPLDRVTDRELGDIIYSLLDTPSTANHAFRNARAFLRWCAKPPRRYIPASPLTGMSAPVKERPRERVLSDAELRSVWRAALRVGHPYGDIVRLLIASGQRRGEIASLQWTWIDESARTITIPAAIAKNGRTHTIPYGTVIDEILATVPRRNSTMMLFPSIIDDQKPYNGWQTAKAHFEKLPAIRPWVVHDLRRTFATNLAGLNVPIHVLEKILNHIAGAVSGVAAIYNRHAYRDEMRVAIDKWDVRLTELLARS